jgi:Beta-lactamase enzyme family
VDGAPGRLTAAAVVAAALVVVSTGAAAELVAPRPWEVFFGAVTAEAPAGATEAHLFAGDRLVVSGRVARGRASFRLNLPPGRYDLRVRFEADGRRLRRDESRSVWLLPPSARVARRERSRDAHLSAQLGRLGLAFPGYAAFWVHDLRTGRTAGWNADASFPAASTVKLGVLVAALDRFGPRPERSAAWHDIRDLAVWSSNLASNRLLVRLGGSEAGGTAIVQQTLLRLGATSSTFTGNYRLGTSVAADTPRPLPILTYRRTTAHDLGRILLELHAAALGNRLSLRRTGLTLHEARVALGLLLQSEPRGDNLGLLRPALGRAVPMAQKHGWTTYLRHTAAIVYGRRGPVIVVVLTYRPDLAPAEALGLGGRVARLLDRLVGTVRVAWYS